MIIIKENQIMSQKIEVFEEMIKSDSRIFEEMIKQDSRIIKEIIDLIDNIHLTILNKRTENKIIQDLVTKGIIGGVIGIIHQKTKNLSTIPNIIQE